jgi:hypothetical protein
MAHVSTDNPVAARRPPLLGLLIRRPALGLWFLFLCSVPFYIGPSGLPQPGNAFLFALLPIAFAGWNRRLDARPTRVFRTLFLFVMWVWVVNYAWGVITDDLLDGRYALTPLYYTFNALSVLVALVLAQRYRDGFLWVTVCATIVMAVFQVVASGFYRGGALRTSLFFNNPNQLGYWSLLAATIVALAHRRLMLGVPATLVGLLASAYLAVLSGSRAATGGVAICGVLLVASSPRVMLVAALASVALLAFGGDPRGALDQDGLKALQRGDRGVSFADERAYTRIWKFKEYVITGAGEGGYKRFAQPGHQALEIHSSLGTVVFCYGIIGLALFAQLFVQLFRQVNLSVSILMLPMMMYSIAHQGLRFSLFWIVIALFAGVAPHLTKARARSVPAAL